MKLTEDVSPADHRRAAVLIGHMIGHNDDGAQVILDEAAREGRSDELTLTLAVHVSAAAVIHARSRRLAAALWAHTVRRAVAREAATTANGEN